MIPIEINDRALAMPGDIWLGDCYAIPEMIYETETSQLIA